MHENPKCQLRCGRYIRTHRIVWRQLSSRRKIGHLLQVAVGADCGCAIIYVKHVLN